MKKIFVFMILLLTSGFYHNTNAQPVTSDNEMAAGKKNKLKGEKIFIKNADKCLTLIEQSAQKLSIKGVAVIAFIPGDTTESWISKMKVVGNLTTGTANLLAIANSKASEMADTHLDSGSRIRVPKSGEFGYQGGVIKKVNSGYIIAVFSGGSGQEDLEVAKKGLDLLSKYY
jgi:hypothetical protein